VESSTIHALSGYRVTANVPVLPEGGQDTRPRLTKTKVPLALKDQPQESPATEGLHSRPDSPDQNTGHPLSTHSLLADDGATTLIPNPDPKPWTHGRSPPLVVRPGREDRRLVGLAVVGVGDPGGWHRRRKLEYPGRCPLPLLLVVRQLLAVGLKGRA